MENILSQIIVSQKETKKELAEQTKVLYKLFDIEKKRAQLDKLKLNEEKRRARDTKKRATDEASSFMNKLRSEMKGGSITDAIVKGPGGLLGQLKDILKKGAIVAAIGGALGGALYKFFTDKQLRDTVVNGLFGSGGLFGPENRRAMLDGLFGKGGLFGPENRRALFNGIKDFLIGENGILRSFQGVAAAAAALAVVFGPGKLLGAATGIVGAFGKITGILGPLGKGLQGLSTILGSAAFVKILGLVGAPITLASLFGKLYKDYKFNKSGGESGGGNLSEEIDKTLNEFRDQIPGAGRSRAQRFLANEGVQARLAIQRELQAATDQLYAEEQAATTTTTNSRGKSRSTVNQAEMDAAQARYQAKIAEIEARYRALDPLKKQRGGHINVPGQGSGDKVPMMLPPGSFVMNRNAAAMLQTGGLVPTLLEPGEKVFGPGQWGPMEQMMNSTFGRFQIGGMVSAPNPPTVEGQDRSGASDPGGSATHAYLTALNDQNIVKRSAPPGYCVTGTLETMQASGVPNPAATGMDRNNPRGLIAQMIANYGWNSMGVGTPKTLTSPYATVGVNNMSGSEYLNQVKAGNIPSGALIFQTRHSDWNNGNIGSSGFDAAIAQNGGMSLWNGQQIDGPQVYSGLKNVIALTPDGMGANGQGLFGNMFNTSFGEYASKLAGLGNAILNTFFDVFELPTEIKDMIQGGGRAIGNLLGIGGGAGPVAPLAGDNLAKAKQMHDYIVSQGYTSAQAKGIVANIERESTFNAKARSGDDGGPGGLFQWKGSRQTAMVDQLVRAGDWKGQIDYALREDVGPQYRSATAGMNAMDASMWWAENWERPASLQNARNKHSQFLQRYGFQNGGVVNMSGTGSYSNSNMISKSQEMFAEKIAEAVTPVVVPMPTGGGGAGAVVQGGLGGLEMPDMPSGNSSIVAMEYKYRITMGASV